MYPTLYKGWSTYGLLIGVGMTLGLWLAHRETRRTATDVPGETSFLLDLGFAILVAGFIGARLGYVLTHASEYVAACRERLWRCTEPLQIWQGGLVYYGGIVAGLGALVWLAQKRHQDFFVWTDRLIPSVALAHFFGRLGCYAAGCCWGKPTGGSWGVRFPPGSVAFSDLASFGRTDLSQTPPLHPTELYEAAGELALFGLLLFLRPRKRFSGQLCLRYFLLYPVMRFVIELYRGDPERKFVAELHTPRVAALLGLPAGEPLLLSTSQAVSLAAIVVVLVVGWIRARYYGDLDIRRNRLASRNA